MIKVKKITESSFMVNGLSNSNREAVTLYVNREEMYQLLYAAEQVMIKEEIKNGRLL